MTYKTLFTNDADQVVYACISDDGKSYSSCTENHPPFQAWLAEGNEPLPAE